MTHTHVRVRVLDPCQYQRTCSHVYTSTITHQGLHAQPMSAVTKNVSSHVHITHTYVRVRVFGPCQQSPKNVFSNETPIFSHMRRKGPNFSIVSY